MQDKLSIGIIGCGNMGGTHAREFKRVGTHIKALAEPREEIAQSLKEEVGADYVVADGMELMNDKDIDAIVIATHHDLHTPLAIEAARAGKHLFIEKPLALTIEECDEIEKAVNDANVKAMCGFQARFSPFCVKLRETIGKPMVIVAALVDPMWGPTIWANDPKEGGGNILSQGCHMFDMMCYFAQSEPTIIHAEGGNFQHPTLPITDSVVATMRFDNGVVAAAINGDYGTNPVLGKAAYHLYAGSKVGALIRYYDEPELHFWGTEPAKVTSKDLLPEDMKSVEDKGRKSRTRLWLHGYCQQIEAFVNWVTKDIRHPDTCGIYEAARATKMAVRCIESIRQEATVTM